MLVVPFCYDGCPNAINKGLEIKDGKPTCKKYPKGLPFEQHEVNAKCSYRNDIFKKKINNKKRTP